MRLLQDAEDVNGVHVLDDVTLQSYTGGKSGEWAGKPTGEPPFRTVFCFQGKDGVRPKGGLVQGDDGNFYGTTSEGPVSQDPRVTGGRGTVFKITPKGALATLHVFHNEDGASPTGGLTKGRDGNFYGTTFDNGAVKKGSRHTTSFGTIFRISATGKLTTLYYFGEVPDGQHPMGEMVEGRDGNFYGTTREGGEDSMGTVFKITPTGTLTALHSFKKSQEEGNYPESGLIEGKDGAFYGTTTQGGGAVPGKGWVGSGTAFKITPAGEFTVLHRFPEKEGDGKTPSGGLVEGSDGDFYGTTESGGEAQGHSRWLGVGTIYEIGNGGTYSLLHGFLINEGGRKPAAALTRVRDGNFYGTTMEAHDGLGSVFRFAPPDNLMTLYTFKREVVERRNFGFGPREIDEKAKWAERELEAGRDHPEFMDGAIFRARLLEASDGTLWGTSEQGGISDCGTIFRINPKAAPKP